MIPDQSLVTEPKAVEFINMIKLPSQRNVMVGDHAKFKDNDAAFNSISACHQKLQNAATTIGQLTGDESRNEVEKHVAAKTVADQTIEQLEKTQKVLLAISDAYMRDAEDQLVEVFKLPEGRSSIHSDMARWIEAQAKNGDGGYANIREAVTTNSEFAKVLYQYPHQLLGLPYDQRTDFMNKALEVWSPKSRQAFERYHALRDTAAKYPEVIAKVKASFYNPLKAAKIHKRVAV